MNLLQEALEAAYLLREIAHRSALPRLAHHPVSEEERTAWIAQADRLEEAVLERVPVHPPDCSHDPSVN